MRSAARCARLLRRAPSTIDIDINVFVPPSAGRRCSTRSPPLGRRRRRSTIALSSETGSAALVGSQRGRPLLRLRPGPRGDAAATPVASPSPSVTCRSSAPEHLAVCKAMFDRSKDWLDIEQMLSPPTTRPSEIEGWLERMVGAAIGAAICKCCRRAGLGQRLRPRVDRRSARPARRPRRRRRSSRRSRTRPAGIESSPASSLRQRLALVGAGDQPEDLAGRVERRVGEGHPAVALVGGLGQGDAAVADLEHRVAGDQRGGVAVGAEAEVDEVERARAASFRSRGRRASRSRWVTGIGRSAAWWSIERPRTMWVRLRSSLPGEAIRSSTWNSSVSSQGISSCSPRIASIAQGVRPPLIASAKVPRSATASRAGGGDQLGARGAPPPSRRRRPRARWPRPA